jgi:hypothetical protein
MVIFHSYVKLPEGINGSLSHCFGNGNPMTTLLNPSLEEAFWMIRSFKIMSLVCAKVSKPAGFN